MAEYEWVSKREYNPVKAELEKIIRTVIKIMEKQYDIPDIEYQLIGSGSRHLITRVKNGNKGFDLDYNIIIPTPEEGWRYEPSIIAKNFMDAFKNACNGTSYHYPKHRTSVIQLKKVNQKESKVCYGGDFAIIYYDPNGDAGYWYLKHLDDGNYKFEKRKQSHDVEWKLDEILEFNHVEGWNWIREEYIKLKNRNRNPNKRSCVLYLETVHNVYNQIQQTEEDDEQSGQRGYCVGSLYR